MCQLRIAEPPHEVTPLLVRCHKKPHIRLIVAARKKWGGFLWQLRNPELSQQVLCFVGRIWRYGSAICVCCARLGDQLVDNLRGFFTQRCALHDAYVLASERICGELLHFQRSNRNHHKLHDGSLELPASLLRRSPPETGTSSHSKQPNAIPTRNSHKQPQRITKHASPVAAIASHSEGPSTLHQKRAHEQQQQTTKKKNKICFAFTRATFCLDPKGGLKS